MATHSLTLSGDFADTTEADWLREVEKALKGKGPDSLARRTADGLTIRALYRETDFPAAHDPRGLPGAAPFLRGPTAAPNPWLPWDIRQAFTHPSPQTVNAEILRDLERGVSSLELVIDPEGGSGTQIARQEDIETALAGVDASIAAVAVTSRRGTGLRTAALLARWAQAQANPPAQKLAFNIDPHSALARTGRIDGGIGAALAKAQALAAGLAARFPNAMIYRSDASLVHEAGGSDAQELAWLIASAIDVLRTGAPERLDEADHFIFQVALDANYGVGAAKLRAARRLWARCREALGLAPKPMILQAITSRRMLTIYDPWTNMLRNTCAAFAGAIGGADILTVRAFNEALGEPGELGRRVARNTQIIAMEESQLGRVADPMGGAWFTETLTEELAAAGWAEFQRIEAEGGLAASLASGALQSRIAAVREARARDVARRKLPITGVSEFPLLDEVDAPVEAAAPGPARAVSDDALAHYVPVPPTRGTATEAEPLRPIRLAEPFEALRDAARRASNPPTVFLATLGTLAEYTPRADFARNLLAAGGIRATEAPVPPRSPAELAAAFRASGCRIAVLCGTDSAYETGAAAAAGALKQAGAVRVWLAGRTEAAGIDANLFAGCDALHILQLLHAELGLSA